MRPDDRDMTFYSVHIFTIVRLTRPGSRDLSLRCDVLGDLRDGVQNGVHFNGIIHGVFAGSFPWSCILALLRIGLVLSALLRDADICRRSRSIPTFNYDHDIAILTLPSHSRHTPSYHSIYLPIFQQTSFDPSKSIHDKSSFYNTINLATSCHPVPKRRSF